MMSSSLRGQPPGNNKDKGENSLRRRRSPSPPPSPSPSRHLAPSSSLGAPTLSPNTQRIVKKNRNVGPDASSTTTPATWADKVKGPSNDPPPRTQEPPTATVPTLSLAERLDGLLDAALATVSEIACADACSSHTSRTHNLLRRLIDRVGLTRPFDLQSEATKTNPANKPPSLPPAKSQLTPNGIPARSSEKPKPVSPHTSPRARGSPRRLIIEFPKGKVPQLGARLPPLTIRNRVNSALKKLNAPNHIRVDGAHYSKKGHIVLIASSNCTAAELQPWATHETPLIRKALAPRGLEPDQLPWS
ncbi:hypothetical protein JAAARDRAFT_81779 [Jaapia argillacea MUCL 33604]|uniref:Uncharacterized protein n=1 Tax=Jaapia argillacea MUCL 33604 TaxID=933084 RepID=A0A067P749_9AGAM|nr:hypothetical protein JAAARDRAFT_81779 [Jaapia argillacea MUCL 33604]